MNSNEQNQNSQMYENPEEFFVGDVDGDQEFDGDDGFEIELGDISSQPYDLMSDGDVDDDYEEEWEDDYAHAGADSYGNPISTYVARNDIPSEIMIGDIDPETGAPRRRASRSFSRPRSQSAVIKDRLDRKSVV